MSARSGQAIQRLPEIHLGSPERTTESDKDYSGGDCRLHDVRRVRRPAAGTGHRGPTDRRRTCWTVPAIVAEVQAVNAKLAVLGKEDGEKVAQNVVVENACAVLFFPALFLMDFQVLRQGNRRVAATAKLTLRPWPGKRIAPVAGRSGVLVVDGLANDTRRRVARRICAIENDRKNGEPNPTEFGRLLRAFAALDLTPRRTVGGVPAPWHRRRDRPDGQPGTVRTCAMAR